VITSISSDTKNHATPNVRIASGKVTTLRSGFSTVLSTPKTAAAAIRAPALETSTLRSRPATTASTSAFVSHEIPSRTNNEGDRDPWSVVFRTLGFMLSAYATPCAAGDDGAPDRCPGDQDATDGISWIALVGDANRVEQWLGGTALPVRVVDGESAVRALGVGERELRTR
jgi:hypothetical protein